MKSFLSIVLIAAAVSCAAFLVGCSAQQTAAQTLIGLQSATDIYVSLYAPGWAGKAKLDAAFTKAIADVEAFKPGTASATTVQVLQDLAGALDEIPLNGQTDQAIAAGINFIDNEIALIQSESTASSAQVDAVFYAWVTNEAPSTVTRKHVWTGKPVKTPHALKKAWNKSAPKAKLK
jgi:hypothetical protein